MTFLLALLLASSPVAGDSLLTLEAAIPLEHVEGRIDHMAFDPKRQRVYVAALGNNTLEIVDLAACKWVGRIEGLHEPQGVAYVPYSDFIVVTNGGDGFCDFYDGGSLKSLKHLKIGRDADNIRWDAKTNRLFVGYGDGGIAVLDARNMAEMWAVPLPSHPEGFQIDPSGQLAYVNLPGSNEVVQVDLEARKISKRWPTSPSGDNYPMAFDAAHECVYVGCRTRTSLLALNTNSGKLQARHMIEEDVDDVWYDPRGSRIYLSCGSGVLEIFAVHGTELQHLEDLKTGSGARTSLFVPQRGEIIVATPAQASAPARLLVFKIRQ